MLLTSADLPDVVVTRHHTAMAGAARVAIWVEVCDAGDDGAVLYQTPCVPQALRGPLDARDYIDLELHVVRWLRANGYVRVPVISQDLRPLWSLRDVYYQHNA